MNAEQQDEYIVQALRMQGAMYEGDARQFLAEHDSRVRAEVLVEAADHIDATQARIEAAEVEEHGSLDAEAEAIGASVRCMAGLLRARANPAIKEKATAAAATATPFFQPGRSYLVDGHEFRCTHLDAHPVKGEPEAQGWFHRGDDRWQHRRFYDTEWARSAPYTGEAGCG